MTEEKASSKEDDKSTPAISEQKEQDHLTLYLQGDFDTNTVSALDDTMHHLEDVETKTVTLNLASINKIDTAGAWLIERLHHKLNQKGISVKFEGAKHDWLSLFNEVGAAYNNDEDTGDRKGADPFYQRFFGWLGKKIVNSGHDFKMAMYILGSVIIGTQMKKKKKRSTVNMAALVSQMDTMGVGAVPIIILMSFIVGAIIAQQGAFQLRQFGAEIFTVDLVGILVFRELGVLLTAIMIAGRSGSAITAEIGSMRMREETDALKVMGLNPIGVLVLPRLVALVIVLPLLTVVANVAALVGAGFIAYFYSGIPVDAYVSRLVDMVGLTTYFAGLIKAPFMALIIGIIAAVEGLKVGGSAESLGRNVTASVVKAIFWMIIVDGFFAIFYAAINF